MIHRKEIGLGILILSVMALILILYISPGTYRFSDYCIDEEEWNRLLSSRVEASPDLLLNLKLNEYNLILDITKERWFYSLIEKDTLAYDPPVRYTGKTENIKIAFKAARITDELIASNEEIEVLAYTSEEYHIYHLICTTLPLLQITYDPNETSAAENRVPGNMEFYLFDNRYNATQRITTSLGTFHVRGGSSASFPKKGYRVTLQQPSLGGNLRENHLSLLGMRQDGDWVLYAAYNDQEKVRNVFSSNLWTVSCANNNALGITNGVEYRYVELFFNNAYHGLYALGFPIDEKQLELSTDERGNYTEYLFKKVNWVLSETDETLLNADTLSGYELKSPTPDEEKAWDALISYYRTLEFTDDIGTLYQIGDIDNMIDSFLFVNFAQGVDNGSVAGIKNFYITLRQINERFYTLYNIWDLDQTWGNIWSTDGKNHIEPYGFSSDSHRIMGLNPVFHLQALGDSQINKLLLKRYQQLRQTTWSEESILTMLNELEADIFGSGAYFRDMERWPDGTYEDPDNKLSIFKDYVLERMGYMDAYMKEYDY